MSNKLLIATYIIVIAAGIVGGIIIGVLYMDEATDGVGDGTPFTVEADRPAHTFEDLLDAIEWVESKGDPNAVGDPQYFSSWAEAEGHRSDNEIINIDFSDCPPFDEDSETIIIEDIVIGTEQCAKIYIYQAIGAYQIHKIYVDDVNRILGDDWPYKYEYTERWNKQVSRAMTRFYIEYYGWKAAHEIGLAFFEDMARIHNGGPDGWKDPSTLNYWYCVKARMESVK